MNDDWKGLLSLFGIGFVLGLMLCLGLIECSGSLSLPYKRGQVDAQTGAIHWSLKDNPDGTREWKHD